MQWFSILQIVATKCALRLFCNRNFFLHKKCMQKNEIECCFQKGNPITLATSIHYFMKKSTYFLIQSQVIHVRIIKDLWIYGQYTQIVKYIVGEDSKTLIALLMPKIFLIFWPRCSLERSYNPLCWIQNQGFTQIFTRNTRKLANDSRKTLGHPWYELMTTSDNQIGSDWIRMRMTWGWLRNIAINSRYFSSLFLVIFLCIKELRASTNLIFFISL